MTERRPLDDTAGFRDGGGRDDGSLGSILLALMIVLALAGCGGGGAGAGDGPAATVPARSQWGLSSINADIAYRNIESVKGQAAEPGSGVTIGFIDSGIDKDHPAFAGKKVTEEFLEGAADEKGQGRFSHGTGVASVAAGVRPVRTDAVPGVAPGADIAMFAIPTGIARGKYRPISLTPSRRRGRRLGEECQ